jgi:hypothetical protein
LSYTVVIDDDLDYFEGPASGPPATHAATHVTGGGDTVADAIAAGNSGLMSGADKTNLDSAVSLKHAAVTVSAPISLSTQAISLVNDAVSPATVTAIAIDGTFASNSDTLIPTQKAAKTYADTKTTLAAVKADADVASAISLKHAEVHTLNSHTAADGTVDFNLQQANDLVVKTVANEAALPTTDIAIGELCWATGELSLHICTVAT